MKPSLIICSYRRPDRLEAGLAEVDLLGLAENEGELVLVSTSGDEATAAIMHQFKATPRVQIKVVCAERRGLPPVARNAGIYNATGELLIFTDDDCLMTSGYVNNVLTRMTGEISYGGGGLRDPARHSANASHLISGVILPQRTLLGAGIIPGANMFFRKAVFQRIGGFREAYMVLGGLRFPCLGTCSDTVSSPAPFGFQIRKSLVRVMAAIFTSFVTSSPSEARKVTVVVNSLGSELSIENGTRTDLPVMPKVGRSRLKSSTSGSLVRLPTGTAKTGTPRILSAAAASTGGCPSFQSPSEASTTPRRFWILCGARMSGSFRSVPWPAFGSENGWITTFIRSRSFCHVESRASLAIASCRVTGGPAAARAAPAAAAGAGNRVASLHAGRCVQQHRDRRLLLRAGIPRSTPAD